MNEIECYILCLWAICLSSSVKYLFMSFVDVSFQLFSLHLLICNSSYIFWILIFLLGICVADIFSVYDLVWRTDAFNFN